MPDPPQAMREGRADQTKVREATSPASNQQGATVKVNSTPPTGTLEEVPTSSRQKGPDLFNTIGEGQGIPVERGEATPQASSSREEKKTETKGAGPSRPLKPVTLPHKYERVTGPLPASQVPDPRSATGKPVSYRDALIGAPPSQEPSKPLSSPSLIVEEEVEGWLKGERSGKKR